MFWEGSPPNFTHISFILAPGKAKTFSIQLWINIHMLFPFPFSIICLFSQLHWVSLCQQLWGFALAGGGEREGSILSQGEEVSRGSMVQTVGCMCVWQIPRGHKCRKKYIYNCVTKKEPKYKRHSFLPSFHTSPNNGARALPADPLRLCHKCVMRLLH